MADETRTPEPSGGITDRMRWLIQQTMDDDPRWSASQGDDDRWLDGTDVCLSWDVVESELPVDISAEFDVEPLTLSLWMNAGTYLMRPWIKDTVTSLFGTGLIRVVPRVDPWYVMPAEPDLIPWLVSLECVVPLGDLSRPAPMALLTDLMLRQAVVLGLALSECVPLKRRDEWPGEWIEPRLGGREEVGVRSPEGIVALLPDLDWPENLATPVRQSLSTRWLPQFLGIPFVPDTISGYVREIEPWTWGGSGWADTDNGPGTAASALAHSPEVDRILRGDLQPRLLLSVCRDAQGRLVASTTVVERGLAIVAQTGGEDGGPFRDFRSVPVGARVRLQQFDCDLVHRLVRAAPQPSGFLFIASSDLHGDAPLRRAQWGSHATVEDRPIADDNVNEVGIEGGLRLLSRRLADHLTKP